MDYTRIITIEPGKRSGQPCIQGLRITVSDVLGYLAAGMTVEEVLDDLPYVTRDDVLACLAHAADRERGGREHAAEIQEHCSNRSAAILVIQ
jgi:uncharacterized protein (DUF433 family)